MVFSYGRSNLPRNLPDCIILDNWVFDNLISVDKWLTKALRRFATCLLVYNSLWGKFVSLSPIIFDDNLKTISVLFFIADFNLLSCEFDIFTFKLLHCVSFILIKIKHLYDVCLYKNFTVTCENSRTVSFASSRMKYNLVFPALSKFAVKLIFWIVNCFRISIWHLLFT